MTSIAKNFESMRASRTAGPLSSTAELPAFQLSRHNFKVCCNRSKKKLGVSPSKNGKVVLFLCWTLDYMSPLLHQNLITFFKKDQYMYRCDTCTKIEF